MKRDHEVINSKNEHNKYTPKHDEDIMLPIS